MSESERYSKDQATGFESMSVAESSLCAFFKRYVTFVPNNANFWMFFSPQPCSTHVAPLPQCHYFHLLTKAGGVFLSHQSHNASVEWFRSPLQEPQHALHPLHSPNCKMLGISLSLRQNPHYLFQIFTYQEYVHSTEDLTGIFCLL